MGDDAAPASPRRRGRAGEGPRKLLCRRQPKREGLNRPVALTAARWEAAAAPREAATTEAGDWRGPLRLVVVATGWLGAALRRGQSCHGFFRHLLVGTTTTAAGAGANGKRVTGRLPLSWRIRDRTCTSTPATIYILYGYLAARGRRTESRGPISIVPSLAAPNLDAWQVTGLHHPGPCPTPGTSWRELEKFPTETDSCSSLILPKATRRPRL